MSVTHPLLKSLKENIVALLSAPEPRVITDDHDRLKPSCEILERIVMRGKRDFAPVSLTAVSRALRGTSDFKIGVLRSGVEHAINSPKVTTNEGRLRLVMRFCLVKKTLSELFSVIASSSARLYNNQDSILGDEILTQILLSMTGQLCVQVDFNLSLDNALFLDETWTLPIYREYVFVPSDVLGMRIAFAGGRPFVIDVTKGSVVAEDDRVECGDVIDTLFGECLYNQQRNKARLLLRANRGNPIKIVILKALLPDGKLFPPLFSAMKTLKLDAAQLEQARAKRKEIDSAMLALDDKAPRRSNEFSVLFCGSAELGKNGDIAHLSLGIERVIRNSERIEKQAYLHVGETVVVARDATNGKVFRKENYTQISACGCREDVPEYFGYICGESACSIAETFTCYVFRAASKHQSLAMVEMIADGFERTGWAV